MKEITVVLKGETPLLMHRFDTSGKKTDKLEPAEQAEVGAYRDADGDLCVPTDNVFSMLVAAGSQQHKEGGGKATMSKVIGSSVTVPGLNLKLKDSEGNPIRNYEVHAKPVRIRATGGRIVRYRPLVPEWKLEVLTRYNESQLKETDVFSAFELAGQIVASVRLASGDEGALWNL